MIERTLGGSFNAESGVVGTIHFSYAISSYKGNCRKESLLFLSSCYQVLLLSLLCNFCTSAIVPHGHYLLHRVRVSNT